MILLPLICLTYFAFLAPVYAAIRLSCSKYKKEKIKLVVTSIKTTSPECEVIVHDPTKQ